jgi:hypothetical protein
MGTARLERCPNMGGGKVWDQPRGDMPVHDPERFRVPIARAAKIVVQLLKYI